MLWSGRHAEWELILHASSTDKTRAECDQNVRSTQCLGLQALTVNIAVSAQKSRHWPERRSEQVAPMPQAPGLY